MDGLRRSLMRRVHARLRLQPARQPAHSGELSRKEGGKIFGSGSRAPVAITLLVKNPANIGHASIRYHDIGDYLDREEKLKIVRDFASISGIENAKKWTMLQPNAEHDWINQARSGIREVLALRVTKDDETSAIFDELLAA